MSVFHSGASGFNMLDLTFTSGPVSSQFASSTAFGLNFTDGDQLVFHGSFTGVANNEIGGGTVTEVEFDHPGGTASFWIDGFSMDALTVIDDFNATHGLLFGNTFLGQGATYIGSSATDFLLGSDSSGIYVGGSGTETFETLSGNNSITGGSGIDTVDFVGARSEYSIVDNGDGSITVTDSVSGRNGTDHIANVPFLHFSDQRIIDLDGASADLARLYSAAFDRTPDAAGLVGWAKIYHDNIPQSAKDQGVFVSLAETSGGYNGSLSIAAGFTQSAEFQQRYGTLDDTGFVKALYQNVLGRDPDAAGLQGWLDLMHNGDSHGTHFTRDMVLVGFADSPENVQKDSAWLFVY